jgi:putative ABC transport system permease protein
MPAGEQIAVLADRVDEDFITTVGLQIIAGKNFTSQDMKDASNDERQK